MAFVAISAVDLGFVVTQRRPPLGVLLPAIWAGLLLGLIATQAVMGNIEKRGQFLGTALFCAIPVIVVPVYLFALTNAAWLLFGMALIGTLALVAGLRQSYALIAAGRTEAASSPGETADYPGLQKEWAVLVALLTLGLATVFTSWGRRASIPSFATGLWAGLWLGLLVSHAVLKRGERRSILTDGLFASLPLVAIPVRFFVWPDGSWLSWAGAALGMAALAAAGRLAHQIRLVDMPTNEPAAVDDEASESALKKALLRAGSMLNSWFHDALLKWAAGFMLVLAGIVVLLLGRERGQEQLTWIGFLLFCLVGSVGIWTPGLYKRTSRFKAIRIVGQIAFWLSLIAVPFLETLPVGGQLPFIMHPSIRFAGLGIGLLLIGSTWFLQKISLLSAGVEPESKHALEGPISLVLVIAALATILVGVELRRRSSIRFDQTQFVYNNMRGQSTVQPIDQLKTLRIVQPVDLLPVYINYVEFDDGTRIRVDSQLFPAQDAFVTSLRAAGQLNTQSLPAARTELWQRS